MEHVTISTAAINADFMADGLGLGKQVDNIGKFYGIPNALHTVDKKFGTQTFLEVLRVATPHLNCLVEGERVQVLDPKSDFIEDVQFDEMIGSFCDMNATVSTSGFQKELVVEMPDEQTYLGDVFHKRLHITRRSEGGMAVNIGIMRQICMNGAMVNEKGYSSFLRKPGKFTSELADHYHNTLESFSVEEYLTKLFSNNGNEIDASMADVYQMKDVLKSITNDDLADILYQTNRMEDFYQDQGIKVDELPRQMLDKLPSGLTYYEAFNILTSGVKSAPEDSIDNHIKVASFLNPRKIHRMAAVSNLSFKGKPRFNREEVHRWMGDK